MIPEALRIQHLRKNYGTLRALDDVSFSVEPGEIFGFVGSNGAGKSTAMRIVLGVLAADGGEVLLGDTPIDAARRRTIGYMPEERGLYPKMKVGEQLTYLARLHGMGAAEAARSAREWTQRLGVESRWNDDVGDLSLGNQQRVQLAAALVHDPAVLVLDEPSSGLDPVAVDVMSEVLVDKAALGVPVVFSSHQLDLVQRLCHRVGIIAAGRMRALGDVAELRRSRGTRLEVSGPAAHTRWADGVPGVAAAEYAADPRYSGDTAVLTLDGDADDQVILAAALRHGPVHRFAVTTPSLTDLFREVVQS